MQINFRAEQILESAVDASAGECNVYMVQLTFFGDL